MHIDFHDKTNSVTADYVDLIDRLIQYAADAEKITEEAEMSITFVDNNEIQIINRNYRQKDAPTDVISFAMQEEGEGEQQIIGEEIPIVYGDIIISVDKAKEQAEEYEHSVERELGFLALHGFLHLLGYDHMNEADEKKMFGRQEEILNGFGLKREEN
ncbi:probable rRNA maturation factor [Terribacillus saccharophilus]|uniref:Endoribonuclease YbeY n=1 Tax=Terribacillus saccharophilus TaxID=361277 RepID=A0AAX2EAD5_9BACI|nr:rRNA maturation RNase YbeY [Terribacillus saccharophilus]MCM3224454.1 rRNA maturation RNase YbeY [Terribacillus saccharophilus]MEC0283650.1 rRNA maturation RNase YbeY [Terribacillus saccharophilus]MEC0290606.1 rRNA maturation RNase YbeY [Terribacillus saccharophilus]SEM55613.1 probable rRNA maturation factor [Terribacillus saccharophilus]